MICQEFWTWFNPVLSFLFWKCSQISKYFIRWCIIWIILAFFRKCVTQNTYLNVINKLGYLLVEIFTLSTHSVSPKSDLPPKPVLIQFVKLDNKTPLWGFDLFKAEVFLQFRVIRVLFCWHVICSLFHPTLVGKIQQTHMLKYITWHEHCSQKFPVWTAMTVLHVRFTLIRVKINAESSQNESVSVHES